MLFSTALGILILAFIITLHLIWLFFISFLD